MPVATTEQVKLQVLIVEDQEKLRKNLQQALDEAGYQTVAVGDGEAGYFEATTQPFDAVVLDLTLPGKDGLQILQGLRGIGFRKPVLILTARDSVDDRVAGLDAGADDYLVKPFAIPELLARLRAMLRRTQAPLETMLKCADLEMELLSRRVVRKGIEIELSQREFELLEYLVRNKNSNVTREMIARDVWKEPLGVMTNVIDVCINGLRKRVDIAGAKPLIRTIRGVGYAVRDRQ